MSTQVSSQESMAWWVFRTALFASAASLAIYIGYKYATQLHTLEGFYAFLFPLSSLLAVAGMAVAVRPTLAISSGVFVRAGVGAVSVLWIGTGMMCVPQLMESVVKTPTGGMFAIFHMGTQHVFLSLSLIAFAIVPREMLAKFGISSLAAKSDVRYQGDQVATTN